MATEETDQHGAGEAESKQKDALAAYKAALLEEETWLERVQAAKKKEHHDAE